VRTLIVGLGNPVLGDDGVGWKVAELVRETIQSPQAGENQIEVDCLSLGGISLMERLIGYDRAILIDAIELGLGPQGSVYQFDLAQLPDPVAGHTSSAHDTTLQSAIELGKTLGAHLPEKITVIAVEVHNDYEFSESISPPVAAAIPQAAQMVVQELNHQADN
jgi:hydrogenase maturation protease